MSEFNDTMRQERANQSSNAQKAAMQSLVAQITALNSTNLQLVAKLESIETKVDALSTKKTSTYKKKVVDES